MDTDGHLFRGLMPSGSPLLCRELRFFETLWQNMPYRSLCRRLNRPSKHLLSVKICVHLWFKLRTLE